MAVKKQVDEVSEPKDKAMNLYEKLLFIQERVIGLGKNETTKSQYNPKGYDYVNGDKVIGVIKPLMNQIGLLLIPETTAIDNQIITYDFKGNSKTEVLSKVTMSFTWVDVATGNERRCEWGANGLNGFEKGLGSALTYAERYFLLKFFHIATDGDDIDNPHRRDNPEPETIKKPEPLKEQETNPIQGIDYSEKIKRVADLRSLGLLWKSFTDEDKELNKDVASKMRKFLEEKNKKEKNGN